jgi:hypothetical protein
LVRELDLAATYRLSIMLALHAAYANDDMYRIVLLPHKENPLVDISMNSVTSHVSGCTDRNLSSVRGTPRYVDV